jgi:hypothetical protein
MTCDGMAPGGQTVGFGSISEAHLHRYLAQWDYKFNTRKTSDAERVS